MPSRETLKGGQRGRGTQRTTNFLRVLTSAEVATIFYSASTLLNQLGTRVSHTNVARSQLVDLVNSVLSSQKDSSLGVSCVAYPPFVAHLVTCRGRILLSSSSLPRRGIMLGTSVRKKDGSAHNLCMFL